MINLSRLKEMVEEEMENKIKELEDKLKAKEQELEEFRGVIRKDICSHYVLGECSQKHHNNCVGRNQCIKDLEQECEELKEEIKKHNDDMFKNPPEKRFYCKGCTLPYISKKLKQTLTEIREMLKEICMEECLFDWNKTNKKHCGDCDCRYGQILQKICECEGNNETN